MVWVHTPRFTEVVLGSEIMIWVCIPRLTEVMLGSEIIVDVFFFSFGRMFQIVW